MRRKSKLRNFVEETLAAVAILVIGFGVLIAAKHIGEAVDAREAKEAMAMEMETIDNSLVPDGFVRIEPVDYEDETEIIYQTVEYNYVLRYGIWNNGAIETFDGNCWGIINDGPEYENGTYIRVLFDGKGTANAKDDIIIDLVQICEDCYKEINH